MQMKMTNCQVCALVVACEYYPPIKNSMKHKTELCPDYGWSAGLKIERLPLPLLEARNGPGEIVGTSAIDPAARTNCDDSLAAADSAGACTAGRWCTHIYRVCDNVFLSGAGLVCGKVIKRARCRVVAQLYNFAYRKTLNRINCSLSCCYIHWTVANNFITLSEWNAI